MKDVIYYVLGLLLLIFIFLVTLPFKLLSMLYYWESMSTFTDKNREEYLEIILNLVCSIMHYKNDN